MKKFWIVLFPDTFFWIKNNRGIIYNSKNFRHCTFHVTDEIKKLYDTLIDLDSLYSVEITESLLCKIHVKEWVDKITTIEAGCLIEQNGQNQKQISYCPVLSIQNDIKRIQWENKKNMGGRIIENLHELVFYINGSKHGSDQYFMQTNYPTNSNMFFDFNHIAYFVKQCHNKMLNQVTFIGDLGNYKSLEQLKHWIFSNDYLIHFVLLAEDFEKKITKLNWLNSNIISITIIVSKHSTFSKRLEFYREFPDNVTFVFPVISTNQYHSISSFMQETNLKNNIIVPLYNGRNKKFFEENVYMSIDEFNNINLSKREVFANMTLNIFSFGKLTVMPDEKIYSNVNDPPLGSIGDPIYDMIYKEMTQRKTWFHVRDMKPCCDCVYQWLCPSPGNYEKVIGKPDLCHVRVT